MNRPVWTPEEGWTEEGKKLFPHKHTFKLHTIGKLRILECESCPFSFPEPDRRESTK